MKRTWTAKLITGLLTLGLLASPLLLALDTARAQGTSPNYFFLQVVDERGEVIASGLTCEIRTTATDTISTIYSDQQSTAKANPFTADSSGQCAWFSTATTAVDLIVWQAGRGAKARMNAVTVNDHKMVLDRQGITKVLRTAWSTITSNGGKVVTTVTIPKGGVVHDLIIDVRVATGAAHIAIGIDGNETGGNDRGFCSGGSQTVGS